ncbi:hypothetical protein HPS57_13090 [Prevotella sp. PINT]|nr:hypothetical protein [Palleniella intestinalis]NPD82904.1 hypothetical protein [Palleniella intestinalis]
MALPHIYVWTIDRHTAEAGGYRKGCGSATPSALDLCMGYRMAFYH